MPEAGVLFDCDGTLLNTERVWSTAEESTVCRYDAEWSPSLKRLLVGRTAAERADVLADHAEVDDADRAGVVDVLATTFSELLYAGHAKAQPGAEWLLRELTEHRIRTGVVSTSPRKLTEASLRRTGLLPWIDLLLCADDEQPGEPTSTLYANACNKLDVAAATSVAFDDAQPGVDAALAAGLYAVTVPGLVPTSGAHARIDSLEHVQIAALMRGARWRPPHA